MTDNTILKVNDLHKAFGSHQVHKGVSFELKLGETLGLLGNSGTGKSVLLRSLIGLEFIDQGDIIFKGEKIDQLTEAQWAKYRTQISYSFQSGALFDSVNVFENLAYPLKEHTQMDDAAILEKVRSALKLVGLEGKEHLMPSDLSGGMQKRVGMARSIILNPEIILYDEPTAGLDPLNVENILGVMLNLKRHKISSIFVTHDIPAATKICDRIIILDEGKVAFTGTGPELQSSSNPIVQRFFKIHEMELMGIKE